MAKPRLILYLITATLLQSWAWTHVLALELPQLSMYGFITKETIIDIMSHSQFHKTRIYTETCMALSLRQAYDYWQDQPGSTQRAALKGRQNTKRVSHPGGKQRHKHYLASGLRHTSMTQLQDPVLFSRNHQIRGRLQLDSVSVHAVQNIDFQASRSTHHTTSSRS